MVSLPMDTFRLGEHHEAMQTCHHLPVDCVLDVATCSITHFL